MRSDMPTSLEDVSWLFGPEGMVYSRDHDVFLREVLQNALDAIEIRRGTEGASEELNNVRVTF